MEDQDQAGQASDRGLQEAVTWFRGLDEERVRTMIGDGTISRLGRREMRIRLPEEFADPNAAEEFPPKAGSPT